MSRGMAQAAKELAMGKQYGGTKSSAAAKRKMGTKGGVPRQTFNTPAVAGPAGVAVNDVVPESPVEAPPPPASPDDSQQAAPLFEVAWEVCWQLGGISTVLKTKSPAMVEGWGDRYCLIGPYNPATADVEFE